MARQDSNGQYLESTQAENFVLCVVEVLPQRLMILRCTLLGWTTKVSPYGVAGVIWLVITASCSLVFDRHAICLGSKIAVTRLSVSWSCHWVLKVCKGSDHNSRFTGIRDWLCVLPEDLDTNCVSWQGSSCNAPWTAALIISLLWNWHGVYFETVDYLSGNNPMSIWKQLKVYLETAQCLSGNNSLSTLKQSFVYLETTLCLIGNIDSYVYRHAFWN